MAQQENSENWNLNQLKLHSLSSLVKTGQISFNPPAPPRPAAPAARPRPPCASRCRCRSPLCDWLVLVRAHMGHDVSNMRGFDSYRLLTLPPWQL